MNLSKSKYCLARQCLKALWLDKFKPELAHIDESVEARFDIGREVGELAKNLFGAYTDVTRYKADGSLDLDAMISATREAIARGDANICEAAFAFDGLYCAVDILRRNGDGYAICEVKSSTHVSEIYVIDVSYQKYVLEKCGVKITGAYLVNLDNKYERGETLEIKKLFRMNDILAAVDAEQANVAHYLAEAERTLSLSAEPECGLGAYCKSPYDCKFWNYCSRFLPSPSVFDVYRMSQTDKFELYDSGAVSFADIENRGAKLTPAQSRQIDFALRERGTHIDKTGIAAFLDKLFYPLYFLDFETMQLAVPEFVGSKPYQQIPFQYSLHYIPGEGGELCHKEFLAESGEDPRRAIAESLCANIPSGACILAYNKSFECGRIKELAATFPDLAPRLSEIERNIVDLIEPFGKGYYYNRAMGGSFSIKSVLPAMFPNDPALDYANLDGVHNGAQAMSVFPRIKDMPQAEREAARAELLRYCALDTFAMVKIWQKLRDSVNR